MIRIEIHVPNGKKLYVFVNPAHIVSLEDSGDGRYYLRTSADDGWHITKNEGERVMNILNGKYGVQL